MLDLQQEHNFHMSSGKFSLNFGQMLIVLLAVFFIGLSTYGITKSIEKNYRTALTIELQTVLKGVIQSIHIWGQGQRLWLETLANHGHVAESARELLTLPREQKELLASPAQEELRKELGSFVEPGIYEGYFIIAEDGISLASSRDVNIGTPNLLNRYPELLASVWEGQTRLAPIQSSDVPLQQLRSAPDVGNETMLMATPLKDKAGKIIAILAVRINPYNTLFPIMENARLGETGDSYVFDRQGTLLSLSRHNEELIRIGLLKPWQTSAANIRLLDPGIDLTETRQEKLLPDEWPLTRMAASATQGESGIDLDGYRDFRGAPVVGAWSWDKELDFGFAVEQQVSESYGLFYFVRLATVIGATMSSIILIVLIMVFAYGRRKIDSVQNRLQSIVETANDGIVVIDQMGNMGSVNPAMQRIFGYQAELLIGNNINMLMPKPLHRHHSHLLQALESNDDKVFGKTIEIAGLRASGETFPLELTINRILLDSRLYYSGVLRDISERKLAAKELEQERDFTREVLDSLQAHIAVLDHNGEIVLTNQAWRSYSERNHPEAHLDDDSFDPQINQQLPLLCSDESIEAIQGLLEMLHGGINSYELKYPCETSTERHWFDMHAYRFQHRGKSAIVVSHTDITRQMQYELELKSVNEQLRISSLVAENTDNAAIITDVDGIIQWVNRGFTHITGYEFDEVLGRKPGDVLQGPETDMEMVNRISEALLAGNRIEGEILNYRKNRSKFWLHFEITPVYDDQQNLVQFVALEQDISEEKRLIADIKREKEAAEQANMVLSMTQQALDRTGIGEFWIAATDGRVLSANDHACRYLGYNKDEILHLRVPDFDPNFSDTEFQKLTAPILEKGWGRIETTHLTREGKHIPVEITIVYLLDPPFGEPMSICFSVDISERKKAERAIIQAREAAIEANRAKSTFLATMSHEIRTPLYGVVGTVDMLAHTRLDSAQKDLVNTARDSSVLLQGIIDDILDFSKIEAGRLELEQIPVSIEKLVETLGENLQHLAAKNDVELLVYSDPNIPKVKGDPIRLRQILYNLAGNAIKFSSDLTQRKGRVIISVTLQEKKQGKVDICLQVKDNGIGMNSEVQQRLFQAFVQGEEETTRRFGGTGLGLVITERLVSMMEGDINVESVQGEGSTFTVYITLDQISDAAENAGSDLHGLKVVLAHGHEEIASMLTSYLQHAGASVISAAHDRVIEACRSACQGSQDPIIVIDTLGEQGLDRVIRDEMLREFKDIDLRFVVVERGARRFARSHDGNSLVVDLNAMRRVTFLNAVAAAAGRESPIQEIEALPEMVTDKILTIEQAREQGRLILLADDNKTNRKLIGQQLQMIGYCADMAEDGSEALEMWRQGSYDMLMTDCHMPVMDGYQLTETIRHEEGEGVHIPIVAITADALKGTAQKCRTAGMDDYVTKPIQLHQLQELMEKWLHLAKQKQEKTQRQPLNVTKQAVKDVVDPLVLGGLLGAQEKTMLAEYFIDFIETSEPTVGEIRLAVDQNDLPELARLAHKLKSSARAVGANTLADLCLVLEKAGKEEDTGIVIEQIDVFFQAFEQVKAWIFQYTQT